MLPDKLIKTTKRSINRVERDEYFLRIADVVASRSTCVRHFVGAVLVRKGQILATGYNGSAKGAAHCSDIGCIREERNIASGEQHEVCRAIHAEANAIIQCALHGVSCQGATLYCTHSPCILCMKLLINAKIKEVHYRNEYPQTQYELLEPLEIKMVRHQ